jgi:formiminotetrahydrofolate cyclodeaminase
MASFRDFAKLTLAEWLDVLGGADAGPGAGSTLAASTAAAASVLVMVARVSGDAGLAAQAEALVARTAPLARVNAETYAAALSSLEHADPDLSAEQRDFAIGRAFARAALPPLETARAAADVAELAAELAASGDPRVRADALATAARAAGIARGAVELVEVNLTALPGDERVSEAQRSAEAAERALARVR